MGCSECASGPLLAIALILMDREYPNLRPIENTGCIFKRGTRSTGTITADRIFSMGRKFGYHPVTNTIPNNNNNNLSLKIVGSLAARLVGREIRHLILVLRWHRQWQHKIHS